MKYSCPQCKAVLEIQKTFNKKLLISCSKCELEDIFEYTRNFDEVYLDFLSKYDNGSISIKSQNSNNLETEGLVRSKDEIEKMIVGQGLDPLTISIIGSKQDYIAYCKKIKKEKPKIGQAIEEFGLESDIVQSLANIGFERFYKFQEDAITEIIYGQNVVIEAPTASGKTEAFLIPVLHKIKDQHLEKGKIFSVFVYPTKSLARDQHPKISQIAEKLGISVRVFDGDTPQEERRKILEEPPQIIITNFDVIHYHLLNKTKFASALTSAKCMVVDEVHVYSGIFGSNVHYIIKRFKRLAGKIQFIAASATLEDAKNFCESLFGEKMVQIRGSGRKGETDFVMIFPSLRTQRALMVDLTKKICDAKHKTMVFSNSHINSELLAIQAQKNKVNIKVHRAGLMANYRRAVEKGFKEDKIQAISCTPTLELGIDVGNVDCVISSTAPVNRLMQRIGRAARKGQKGFAFLTLGNDPISQYYRNHPEDYFLDSEKTFIDPKNPFVEEYQVLSMAFDRPISKHELKEHQTTIQNLVKAGKLVESGNQLVANYELVRDSINEYSIRGIGKSIDIFLGNKKVGDRILPIALEELHKDAIYFLAGRRYRVKEFDYPKRGYARIESIPKNYPYYTKSLTQEWPTIKEIFETRKVFGMEVAYCSLHIKKEVYGYANIELGQEVTQGQKIFLDSPLEYDFMTKGIVFHAPRPKKEIATSDDEDYVEASGYHATEHVIIEGSNMITGGASQDLGGISLGTSGMIFVYDGAIGGNGASRALYDRFERALQRGLVIVSECPCKDEAGCPRCTFSYRCGNNNEYLHKKSCIETLRRINDGEHTAIEEVPAGDKPLV